MNWLSGVLSILAVSSALAGEAVFAPDGKTVHLVSGQPAKLWTVGVGDGKLAEADFAKELGADDAIKGLAAGPKGTCWVASRLTVWQWTPAEHKLERRATVKGDEIEDIAYNPATDTVFIAGRFGEAAPFAEGLRALPHGEKELVEPKLSVGEIVAPIFDHEGRFYFRHESDLWAGRQLDGGDDVAFNAFRLAPLGNVLSESGEMGASKIISSIAPVAKGLYVAMSSSVEAELIFLPQPATGKAPAGLKDAWKRMAQSLQSISVVPIKGEFARLSALCASADGAQIFFLTDDADGGRKFRLFETKSGKTRTIGDVPKGKE